MGWLALKAVGAAKLIANLAGSRSFSSLIMRDNRESGNLALTVGLSHRGVQRCVTTAFTRLNRGLQKLAVDYARFWHRHARLRSIGRCEYRGLRSSRTELSFAREVRCFPTGLLG